MKKTIFMCMAVGLSLILAAFQPKPWAVPDKYLAMKNPVPSSVESIKDGKDLYVTHCNSCHGKKGKGDGTKAAQLETECGDFTTAAFAKEPDGALFYKMSEGRKDMPSFKKKIPDANDMWNVVNYIRTLK
jgi:mono/diheme cytochrome c family protein